MVIIGHETVGMAEPITAFVDVPEGVQEIQAVCVILEDGLLLIAAGGNMIDCAGVFDAKWTSHGARTAEESAKCKEKDLIL